MATRMDKAVVVAFVKRLWEPLQELCQKQHDELLRAGAAHLVAVVRTLQLVEQ